jgi:REP element-mobilizing transposase RayT
MSLPRPIVAGSTYLITRRCTQRQLLLRPSHQVNQIVLYCLAEAARRTAVEVHAFDVMGNHYHLVVTDVQARLPEFVRWLDEFVAKCLNATLGRWEAVWSPGSYSAVRLEDARAVVEKMIYTLANPVAAGLVSHGYHWPGLRSSTTSARTLRVRRPHVFFRADGPTPEYASLTLTPPPCAEGDEAFWTDLARAVEEREAELRRQAIADGRPFLGRRAILSQSPWTIPSTHEDRRVLRPRVACRDKWKRIEALQRLRQFAVAYREAWLRFRAGYGDMVFPAGTYALRVHYGVPCAPS